MATGNFPTDVNLRLVLSKDHQAFLKKYNRLQRWQILKRAAQLKFSPFMFAQKLTS
jgi:hypothetical protein